jgi:DNA polymerase IV
MEPKIIHLDMDCFYAAIEVRDRPEIRNEPVAVGGSSARGVLTTCNYAARAFGIHSAMPTFMALRKCPHLVIVPIRFDVYRFESKRIRSIMMEYTDLVEPLSLDEAYLDVSHSKRSAIAIAQEIRRRIRNTKGLVASAGIAPNKMLAKIASDWKKPNGLFRIASDEIDSFMKDLPVSKIWGIGKKTSERLGTKDIRACGQLQKFSSLELIHMFGKFGGDLYELCRGIDHRAVVPNRIRKSMSVERTFSTDLETLNQCARKMREIYHALQEDLFNLKSDRQIAKLFIKVKFADFSRTTVERTDIEITEASALELLQEAFGRKALPVRLIGLGVRFANAENRRSQQLEFAFQASAH